MIGRKERRGGNEEGWGKRGGKRKGRLEIKEKRRGEGGGLGWRILNLVVYNITAYVGVKSATRIRCAKCGSEGCVGVGAP